MMTWRQRAHDRRSSVRFDVVGPLLATAASDQYVQVHDVSAGGVLVESHWPIPVDTLVRLKLTPGQAEQVDARVRHVTSIDQCRFLIGLELLMTTPALLQVLHDLAGTVG